MIYAFYRILYGEDFIKESIASIEDEVDKIFIFWTDKFFGDVKGVDYKGEWIEFPAKIDNVIEVIREMNHPKIELIYDHRPNNVNQFTQRVNEYILPHYPKPDYILFIEPDHIFPHNALNTLIEVIEGYDHDCVCYSTGQIEFWKSPSYMTVRPDGGFLNVRYTSMIWDMKTLDEIPLTSHHADHSIISSGSEDVYLSNPSKFYSEGGKVERNVFLIGDIKIYNLGYCYSPQVMYWKMLGSIAYSQHIADTGPYEEWYEDTWMNWDIINNNKNLEPASEFRDFILYARRTPKRLKLEMEKEWF